MGEKIQGWDVEVKKARPDDVKSNTDWQQRGSSESTLQRQYTELEKLEPMLRDIISGKQNINDFYKRIEQYPPEDPRSLKKLLIDLWEQRGSNGEPIISDEMVKNLKSIIMQVAQKDGVPIPKNPNAFTISPSGIPFGLFTIKGADKPYTFLNGKLANGKSITVVGDLGAN